MGIILCRTRKKLIAEYALRNLEAPLGVSAYRFMHEMPAESRPSMPNAKELEKRLNEGDE